MQTDSKNIINIDIEAERALTFATELFQTGRIFIYPTDTIYGIGGNPLDQKVINRISEIKGRDEQKRFIWLISDIDNLLNYTDFAIESHIEILQKIWPAPLSVILKLNERTSELLNQKTVAVRIPSDKFCLNLLKEISRPLISTSVNRTGENPLYRTDLIIEEFSDKVDAILFHTESPERKSSTIIDLTTNKPKLIREGAIKFVELLQNFT